jgi:hypothetical protein
MREEEQRGEEKKKRAERKLPAKRFRDEEGGKKGEIEKMDEKEKKRRAEALTRYVGKVQ